MSDSFPNVQNDGVIVTLFFHKNTRETWTTQDASRLAAAVDKATQLPSFHTTVESSRILDDRRAHFVVEAIITASIPLERLRRLDVLGFIEGQLQAQAVFRDVKTRQLHPPRLAVFDMDSTLIEQEVIELLAAHAGVEDEVTSITSRAMNGELDFTASLKERVALLSGIPETVFEDLKPKMTLMPGAKDLLKCLRSLEVKTAVLSGGFMPLATHIAGILGIDHVHANQLDVLNGRLNGELLPRSDIVHGERKRDLLVEITTKEGIATEGMVLAVGDGANDLPMMWKAGLGIAVNAKPKVQDKAPCRLNTESMLDILHILGYTHDEIEVHLR